MTIRTTHWLKPLSRYISKVVFNGDPCAPHGEEHQRTQHSENQIVVWTDLIKSFSAADPVVQTLPVLQVRQWELEWMRWVIYTFTMMKFVWWPRWWSICNEMEPRSPLIYKIFPVYIFYHPNIFFLNCSLKITQYGIAKSESTNKCTQHLPSSAVIQPRKPRIFVSGRRTCSTWEV